MARYFLRKHRMLPIDAQRGIVFAFKTDAISELRRVEEAEERVKQGVLFRMLDGNNFDDGTRHSLHLLAVQKRFFNSTLVFDVNAAEQHFRDYKEASRAVLDGLVFRESSEPTVVAIAHGDAPPSVHTGDDDMAVAYGDAIKINVDNMRNDLKSIRMLRKTCPVAV